MTTPDPTDARADGAFAGTTHRAGYGDTLYWALRQARKGGTLMAGEGLALIRHYEALVEAAWRSGYSDGVCHGSGLRGRPSEKETAEEWAGSDFKADHSL